MKKIAVSALVAVAAMSSATAASAAQYLLTYSGTKSGSITVTTSNTLNGVGGYDITGVTGVFDGAAVTGLLNNPNQPNFSSNGAFTWDNVLFPGAAQVFDRFGIAFATSVDTINIYDAVADGGNPPPGTPYGLITLQTGGPTFGSMTIAAVPEPASWAMMLAGFGVVGFAMRSQKNRTVKVTYA